MDSPITNESAIFAKENDNPANNEDDESVTVSIRELSVTLRRCNSFNEFIFDFFFFFNRSKWRTKSMRTYTIIVRNL